MNLWFVVRMFCELRYASENLRTQNSRTETGIRTFMHSTPGSEGHMRHHAKWCAYRAPLVELSRFWIFQDGGSHNLGFLKFYILPIWTVKKDELRHCVKFCRNRSNHGRDRAIKYSSAFKFFRIRFVIKISAINLLSLIHIWRCRRSTLCRSRWSPYH